MIKKEANQKPKPTLSEWEQMIQKKPYETLTIQISKIIGLIIFGGLIDRLLLKFNLRIGIDAAILIAFIILWLGYRFIKEWGQAQTKFMQTHIMAKTWDNNFAKILLGIMIFSLIARFAIWH